MDRMRWRELSILGLTGSCALLIPLQTGTDPSGLLLTGGLTAGGGYAAYSVVAARREVATLTKRIETSLAARLAELGGQSNFSKAYFEFRLNQEVQRSRRHNVPLSLLLGEMKLPFGVTAEASVIAAGTSLLRAEDSFAPIGPGEYAFLLPQTPIEGARVVADRLERALVDLEPVFGIASLVPNLVMDGQEVVDAARADVRRRNKLDHWNEGLAVK